MILLETHGATVVVCNLELTGTKVTEGKDMDGVGVAGIQGVETSGEEESIVDQVIVEVVPDELAQLLNKLCG